MRATKLTGKKILILSPQSWGPMYLSKHHYAIELAKAGNTVYFLNPPDGSLQQQIQISPLEPHENLNQIKHKLNFPYNLKFHSLTLFHFLMQFHIKKLLSEIQESIDIVWSFDLGNNYPFRFFPKHCLKIFHPVDEPLTPAAITAAKGAQFIFSVTKEILSRYEKFRVPSYFVNHGVADGFLTNTIPENKAESEKSELKVGFSGNLLRPDIDYSTFLEIVKEHPEIKFECWGAHSGTGSNLGGASTEGLSFVQELKKKPNVLLHGIVPNASLPEAYSRMDAFLICYDIQKDQSKGTNYHKIMEFLSTGKVVIANNTTTYQGYPQLLVMPVSRESNIELPGIFSRVIKNLETYNSLELQNTRIRFSKEHSYEKNVLRIGEIISSCL